MDPKLVEAKISAIIVALKAAMADFTYWGVHIEPFVTAENFAQMATASLNAMDASDGTLVGKLSAVNAALHALAATFTWHGAHIAGNITDEDYQLLSVAAVNAADGVSSP
jgi:hypothetical protein